MITALLLLADAPLNLICTGRAETEDSTPTVSVGYGPNGNTYTGGSETVTQTLTETMKVMIDGDAGEARLPDLIQPPIRSSRDGWFALKKIVRTETEIKARVSYGAIGSAKMKLDRITGMISVDGGGGRFSGECKPYDPTTVERKF